MTNVFISYSRKDQAIADFIAAELKARNAEVFIDYQRLEGGENFIQRIGKEIEKCDFFLLLISPRSVASPWVQAELALAFTQKKKIVPILLETASTSDIFVIVNLEHIDFTRWTMDGKVDNAVQKLVKSLSLPVEPINKNVKPELLFTKAKESISQAENNGEDTTVSPAFKRSDLQQLFFTAVSVAEKDPEQALFLYNKIIEIDPNFMGGQIQEFVEQEKTRIMHFRVPYLLKQAKLATENGRWKEAAQIGKDIIKLDPQNKNGQLLISIAVPKTRWEEIYNQAEIAKEIGNLDAAKKLYLRILMGYPDYGDPRSLLTGFTLDKDVVSRIHEIETLYGHYDSVNAIAVTSDNSYFATGSKDQKVILWDLKTRKIIKDFVGGPTGIKSISFTQNNKTLISTPNTTADLVYIWGNYFSDAPQSSTIKVGKYVASNVAVSSTILYAVGTSMSGAYEIEIHEVPNRKIRSYNTNFPCDFIIYTKDNSALLIGSKNNIMVFVLQTGHTSTFTNCHTDDITYMSLSSKGNLLAVAAKDKYFSLWDIPSNRLLKKIDAHTKEVNSICFSPDDSLIATTSEDGNIKIWHAETGKELVKLTNHTQSVNNAIFSPDQKFLVSVSDDKTIKVWGL